MKSIPQTFSFYATLSAILVSGLITTVVIAQTQGTPDMQTQPQSQTPSAGDIQTPPPAQPQSSGDVQSQDQATTDGQADDGVQANATANATVLGQSPRITAEVQTKPQASLTAGEKHALSQAAGRILFHVDKARQAVANNDPEMALTQIEKGLTLARIIERTVPTYQMSATIKAGDLVYQDEDTVKVLTVPIYAELGEVSVLAPVEAARREEAQRAPKSGLSVVQDVELRHTAVTLDVAQAKRGLKMAKRALGNDQSEAADQALAAVFTTGVNFSYTEMDLPLLRARENLTLAKSLVEQQRPKDARIALHEAADALEMYGKRQPESRAAKVQALRQDLMNFAQTLDRNQAGAAERISAMWDQVAQLMG